MTDSTANLNVLGKTAQRVGIINYPMGQLGYDRFTASGFPKDREDGTNYISLFTKDVKEGTAVHFIGPKMWSEQGFKLANTSVQTPAEPPTDDLHILDANWTITGKIDTNKPTHRATVLQITRLEEKVKEIIKLWNFNPKKHDPALSAKPYDFDFDNKWKHLMFRQQADCSYEARINLPVECFCQGDKQSTMTFLDTDCEPVQATFAECIRDYSHQHSRHLQEEPHRDGLLLSAMLCLFDPHQAHLRHPHETMQPPMQERVYRANAQGRQHNRVQDDFCTAQAAPHPYCRYRDASCACRAARANGRC